ncbi:alkaline phosphatase D family protein [Aestuariimicrobium soli]|uniref:alkaline phosphatase D family protein n=1 Tax=Aestuariimicrobium soli TaxID=2035834 RepID=UPI003EBFD514
MPPSTKHSSLLFSRASLTSRRRFLAAAGGGAAGLAFALGTGTAARAATGPITKDPFTLGVASGDPTHDSVLLWTRLAPEPLAIDAGLDQTARYHLLWEVASDERFQRRIATGQLWTGPEVGHSAHVRVTGLQPGRHYWYRFRTGEHVSPVARTRTAPAPGVESNLTFAFASCMNYRAGWFQTMADVVDQDPDLMMFLGDYIYEYPVQQLAVGRALPTDLPAEVIPTTETLDQYRLRYALYKLDPDLQRAHHAMPWVMTWDDHEVANDYESNLPDDLLRRAAAYRAYWENSPLDWPQRPVGADARLYRRLRWGSLAQFDVLDTRQDRDPQLAASAATDEGERRNPARTVLGDEQEKWFMQGFGAEPARWNFIAQQILFARLNTASSPEKPTMFSPGTWDGYQASQQRMFDAVTTGLDQGRIRNFGCLGGDVHCSYVSDVISDSLDPDSRVIGTDITSPSITSAQDFNPASNEARQIRRTMNPTLKWADLHCGYDLVTVTPERTDYTVRVVDKVSTHDSPVFDGARFTVLDGVPGFTA